VSNGTPIIPTSNSTSGAVRHFICGKWANVEIPEKPHYVSPPAISYALYNPLFYLSIPSA
jgi:hypothetical protein